MKKAVSDSARACSSCSRAAPINQRWPPGALTLWREPRALLTPHVAVVGPYIPQRRLEVLCDNARRFEAGLPLRNVVDKALWY